ncbi:hypothetical protein ACCD10_10085 [Pseudomonas sp. Pseusp122]|uniref:hypothetical protein n=1 Tax=unclassified Pseudomonas TaxID=196821 RepID=UPI0039A77FA0
MNKSNNNFPLPDRSLPFPASVKVAPGLNSVLPPIVVEAYEKDVLYPCAVAESGAVMRMVGYPRMRAGDIVMVAWMGGGGYFGSCEVGKEDRYIDVVIPKAVVLDTALQSSAANAFGHVKFVDGTSQVSHVISFSVPNVTKGLPPVNVPQAVNGEFTPHDIPEPGLRVEFPGPVSVRATWSSYGVDGRLMAMLRFGVPPGATFVYIERVTLERTEPGGEVRISYYSENSDGVLVESLHTALRVLG